MATEISYNKPVFNIRFNQNPSKYTKIPLFSTSNNTKTKSLPNESQNFGYSFCNDSCWRWKELQTNKKCRNTNKFHHINNINCFQIDEKSMECTNKCNTTSNGFETTTSVASETVRWKNSEEHAKRKENLLLHQQSSSNGCRCCYNDVGDTNKITSTNATKTIVTVIHSNSLCFSPFDAESERKKQGFHQFQSLIAKDGGLIVCGRNEKQKHLPNKLFTKKMGRNVLFRNENSSNGQCCPEINCSNVTSTDEHSNNAKCDFVTFCSCYVNDPLDNLFQHQKYQQQKISRIFYTENIVSLPDYSDQEQEQNRLRDQQIRKKIRERFYTTAFVYSSIISVIAGLQKYFRAILPIILLLNMLPFLYAECDQTFVSRIGGPQNGTFTAPVLLNPTNHSRQCLYIFLAGPGQRVEIIFTSFNLRGMPPDGAAVGEIPACGAEYMDIYSEVQSSDPADLINSPFGGRYCGPIPPRQRISLYRAIALSFFTGKNSTSADLFGGRYSFINASVFEIGTPITGSPCSFTITPHKNKSDIFISPTYPGTYPKDLSCSYQFLGESNQRVRLEFRDFDLFFGGPHCPFDFVKVYDGPDNSSALIGTYCGQQRNLVLYSSESSLLVHFFTLQRTAHTQNRGFKGIYEFSEGFVKLDFIRENNGMHIRGSECDQKILSKKESSGLVYSPNYPFPYLPKTVCRYFVYGMQDAQHLERVRLEFQMFEIQKGESKDKDKESNCTDGYLKVFLKGQETQDAYDKFDYEICGFDLPPVMASDGPRLAMVFSSGELQARGFKAKYTFETEYKIPGTAAPDGSCSFTYRSTSRKKGEFNSPRYPSNYPSDTNCSYMFLATPNEQVTIVFDHFKVKADGVNTTGGAYGLSVCFEDWLEMYVIFRDGSDRFLGRYCGFTAPGPVESPRGAVGIRIVLHTDQENVASGFKARYIFEVAKSVFGDCGGNFSGQESGIISSPNYPAKYDGPGKGLASRACNWYLSVRPGYRVSMNFEMFSVEGDPPGRGCPAAVLRLWMAPDTEHAPTELCGEKPFAEPWHYVSQGQSSRISFTTTDKTIGAAGFRIVWTAVQEIGHAAPSSISHHCESSFLFQCEISGYCISEKLRCDKIKNCGPGDETDEMHCTLEVVEDDYGALIISSLAGGSFLICLLCTVCHCKRKRRLHRQLGLHRNAHYDSTTSATGLSSSRRHLQSGGSLSGSLRGISSDIMSIPPVPLPPTSVPPHICITDELIDDDDDDDDDNQNDLFINNGDRYSNGESV